MEHLIFALYATGFVIIIILYFRFLVWIVKIIEKTKFTDYAFLMGVIFFVFTVALIASYLASYL